MTPLLIENHGAVRVLTLNRPDKHNALNTALTQTLLDALRAAEADGSVRAVVLAGAGQSFCAGADIPEFMAPAAEKPQAVMRRADLTTAVHLIFSQMAKPVVAAVHGHALGAGAGLALACDMVVAADTVRFGYPELEHGIVPAVVLANLVRQVGRKSAFELAAMAEVIDAARMLALGLANRRCPEGDVLAVAMQVAARLAGWNPIAMASTKHTLQRVSELSLAQSLDVGRDINVMMRGFRQAAKATDR